MKKYFAVYLIVPVLIVGILLGFNLRNIQAQEQKSFSQVFPFATIGGFIGFFDQKDGTVYIYDEQLKKAVFIYKLNELGQPGIDLSSAEQLSE